MIALAPAGLEEHLELVVDTLAAADPLLGLGNGELRRRTGLDALQVRAALLEAERLGCVTRNGRTKATTWRLS